MTFTVQSNQRLGSSKADKDVFYLTLKSSQPLNYEPGDWLTIQAHNQANLVQQVLKKLELTGHESVEIRRIGVLPAIEALTDHLEITQLNPAILNKLQRQHKIGNWANRAAMMAYAQSRDILDLLEAFPELCAWGVKFLQLLSPLAPRYYSIASAPISANNTLSILYKAVAYQAFGRMHLGVTSQYLAQLKPNAKVKAQIQHNRNFKLPSSTQTPVIMIGAGTGLAPFIGFMQARIEQASYLPSDSTNLLFFGETSRAKHCFFCDTFAQWQEAGWVYTFYAFSRDQAQKEYVQHRLQEQASTIWQAVSEGAHIYICGSQHGLAQDVETTLMSIFAQQGSLNHSEAETLWQSLRQQKRIQLDVY